MINLNESSVNLIYDSLLNYTVYNKNIITEWSLIIDLPYFLGTHQMLPISGKTGTFLFIAGRDGLLSFMLFQPW